MPGPFFGVRRVLLGGGSSSGITYLLRDDFTTDAAAPLVTPRTAEPGPGTWTVADTNNIISISGSQLVVNGTPAGTNLLISPASYARTAGRAFFWKVPTRTTITGRPEIGLTDSSTLNQDVDYGIRILSTTGFTHKVPGSGNVDTGATITLGAGSWRFATIMRASGCHLLSQVDGGTWNLEYVYVSLTAAMYAKIWASNAGTQTVTFDEARITDLTGVWTDDYGIATQRLSGARSAGDTFSHIANCVLEFTITTLPASGNIEIHFRKQDASNYWRIRVNTAGDFLLAEVVAGVGTTRGTGSAVITNGHRCLVIANGSTIQGYSNNAVRWTYASASNFATSTSGELSSLGTSGAASDIVIWPRDVSSYVPATV